MSNATFETSLERDGTLRSEGLGAVNNYNHVCINTNRMHLFHSSVITIENKVSVFLNQTQMFQNIYFHTSSSSKILVS